MDDYIFCMECGQKLPIGAKFCFKCGSKINNEDLDTFDDTEKSEYEDNNDDDDFYEDPREQLHKERQQADFFTTILSTYIDAYINGNTVIKSMYYSDAALYDLDNTDIDEFVKTAEERINGLIAYIDDMYKNKLPLLDVNDNIRDKLRIYADNKFYFSYSDTDSLYDYYIEKNHIIAKNGYLLNQLDFFSEHGEWNETHIKCLDKDEADNFKNTEVKHLIDIANELNKQYTELYDQYDIDIPENKIHALYETAASLGIRSATYIDKIIDGIEASNGAFYKKLVKDNDKLRFENANMFDHVTKSKRYVIASKNIEFESCYFIYDYIRDYFDKQLDDYKKRALKKANDNFSALEKRDSEKDSSDFDGFYIGLFVTQVYEAIYNSMDCFKKLIDRLCNDKSIYKTIKTAYKSLFEQFKDTLDSIGIVYKDINMGVTDAQIYSDTQKALRGRWEFAGVGLKGAATAAVAQGVMNSASGFAYDCLGSVLVKKEKMKAKEAKQELCNEVLNVISRFFDALKQSAAPTVIQVLSMKYLYSVWTQNLATYEENELKKYLPSGYVPPEPSVDTLIADLKKNPRINIRYMDLIKFLTKDGFYKGLYDDTEELLKIAADFGVDKKVTDDLQKLIIRLYDRRTNNGYYEGLYDDTKALLKIADRIGARKKAERVIQQRLTAMTRDLPDTEDREDILTALINTADLVNYKEMITGYVHKKLIKDILDLPTEKITDKITEVESRFGKINDEDKKAVLNVYIRQNILQSINYSDHDDVVAKIDIITKFSSAHEIDCGEIIAEIRRRLIENAELNSPAVIEKSKDIKQIDLCNENIEKLSSLSEQYPMLDFSSDLAVEKNLLEITDIKIRTTKIISGYNISSGEFSYSEHIAKDIDENMNLSNIVKQLEEFLPKLSLQKSSEEFMSSMETIRQILSPTDCMGNLVDDLTHEKGQTLQAELENLELNQIDEFISTEGFIDFKKLHTLLTTKEFTTSAAKNKLSELKQEAYFEYNYYKSKISQKSHHSFKIGELIKNIFSYFLVGAIPMIITIMFSHSSFWRGVSVVWFVLTILAIINEIIESIKNYFSDIAESIEDKKYRERKIKEFDSLFLIQGENLIPR